MRLNKIIAGIVAATALAACSNDNLDNYVTCPDEDAMILFSANTELPETRADGYRDWETTDPTTMGVFGWHSTSLGSEPTEANRMFNNTQNSYIESTESTESTWSYSNPLFWADYTQYNNFLFFAYMPYMEDATLSYADNACTLTTPMVTLADSNPITSDETALICHVPRTDVAPGENPIAFQMDQTLAAYSLSFTLGNKMDQVRYFKIKSVKLYTEGEKKLAYKGTISRTYTTSGPGEITWTVGDDDKTKIAQGSAIKVPKIDTDDELKTDTDDDFIIVGTKTLWCKAFYAIPGVEFNPTIEITYDVQYKPDDESDAIVVTRQNVTSKIQLNSTNFPALVNTLAGKKYPIEINIVPKYLYVLADNDQLFGLEIKN